MSRIQRPGSSRFQPRVELLESRLTPAVTLRFDYSYDTSGFFNDPARRDALERAADQIAPYLHDDLAAITPGGPNSWTASFYNPATNSTAVLNNPTIGEDELLVYVGAAPIGGVELGLASAGGFSASGSQDWLNTVRARGQAGALGGVKTDYSTWGGMVTFNSTSNWGFAEAGPAANQYDFESVAQHELMHVFGFGLGEPAFTRYVVGGQFVGPAVTAVNGGPADVVGSPADHWSPGTDFDGATSPMVPAIMIGEQRQITSLDRAALADIGWELSPSQSRPVSTPTSTPVSSPASIPAAPAQPTIGAFQVSSGVSAAAFEYTTAGKSAVAGQPAAHTPANTRIAHGDVNGDGAVDTIFGTGPGSSSMVRVVDGATGATLVEFQPFEGSYTGGVNVTAGDLSGDGRDEIVVSPGEGGGPRVQIYDGGTARILADLYGIEDQNFRGGVRTAVGDINGDGQLDLVVAAGLGGGPRIAIYDGMSFLSGAPVKLASDFFAFESGLRNGTYVTVTDLDNDGYGDVVVGAGAGGAPRVVAFSGQYLAASQYRTIVDVYVSNTDNRSGVRLASADVDEDGVPDLITGSGPGGSGQIQVFGAADLIAGRVSPFVQIQDDNWIQSGVFVG